MKKNVFTVPAPIRAVSFLRLRTQLVLFSSIGVAIAALGFYYYTVQQQRRLFAEEFDKSTLATLEAVRLGLEVGLTEESYENITTVLNWTKQNPTVHFIVLTDSSHEIIAAYPETLSVTPQQLLASSAILSPENPLFVRSGEWMSRFFGKGRLYIGFSTEYVRLLERKALRDVSTVSLLFLLVSSVGAFFVALSITRPLERLRGVTERIAHNDLESRADEQRGSEEVTSVARSFNTMIEQLLESQEQRMAAHMQLVQSEKMASLGQLIAGVAHEINTPAGAINSAINELEKDYVVLLEQLVETVGSLSPEEREQYLTICHQVLSFDKDLSTKDQRGIAREIQHKLEEQGLDNARSLSKNLAVIGFTAEHVTGLVQLLTTPKSQEIQESFYGLGMSQIQVRDIKIAIGRITQLVKALKSYSHLDQESLVETNLQEDLDNTLIILHNKLKRSITVYKEYDSVPPLRCYADQLNQVWTNLIHNSIQAMRGEGIIHTRIKRINGEEVAVEVEDNGPGIPEDVLPRIFEPYFTTKPKGEGTGLGLSICKEIVEKHEGRIEVTSRPGFTCFRVVLPLSANQVPA
jgi:signal transduction histidine kinase